MEETTHFDLFTEENLTESINDMFKVPNPDHLNEVWIVEVEPNIFQDPYSSIWIKVGVSASYLIQGIESVILISFVLYETQGLAGPYRTVVNQLLSGLYAIVRNRNKAISVNTYM